MSESNVFKYTYLAADESVLAVAQRFGDNADAIALRSPAVAGIGSLEDIQPGTELVIATPRDALPLDCVWESVAVTNGKTLAAMLDAWAKGQSRGRLIFDASTPQSRRIVWLHHRNAPVRARILQGSPPEAEHAHDLDDPGTAILKTGDRLYLPIRPIIEHEIHALPQTDAGTSPSATHELCLSDYSQLWDKLWEIEKVIDQMADARAGIVSVSMKCTDYQVAFEQLATKASKRFNEIKPLTKVGEADRKAVVDRLAELAQVGKQALVANGDAAIELRKGWQNQFTTHQEMLWRLITDRDTIALLHSVAAELTEMPYPVLGGRGWGTDPKRKALERLHEITAAVAFWVSEAEEPSRSATAMGAAVRAIKSGSAPSPGAQSVLEYGCAVAAADNDPTSPTSSTSLSCVGVVLASYAASKVERAGQARRKSLGDEATKLVSEAIDSTEGALLKQLAPVLDVLKVPHGTFKEALAAILKRYGLYTKVDGTIDEVKKAMAGYTKWNGRKAPKKFSEWSDEEIVARLREIVGDRDTRIIEMETELLERKLEALNDPVKRLGGAFKAVSTASGNLFAILSFASALKSLADADRDAWNAPALAADLAAASATLGAAKAGLSLLTKFKWISEATAEPAVKWLGRGSLMLGVSTNLVQAYRDFSSGDAVSGVGEALMAGGSVVIVATSGCGVVIGGAMYGAGVVLTSRDLLGDVVQSELTYEYKKVIPPARVYFADAPGQLKPKLAETDDAFARAIFHPAVIAALLAEKAAEQPGVLKL